MRAATYWRLSSFYFAYFVVLGSFTPYWSLWLDDRGLSAAWIAVLMGTSWLTRVFAPPLWTAAAGTARQPRRWLRAGALLTLISYVGFLVGPDLAALLVLMLAFTFFYNAILPQFEVLTLSHLKQHPAAYGRIRLWGSIGFIAAVLAMGLLLDRLPIHWLPWLMLPAVLALLASAYANDYDQAAPTSEAGPRVVLPGLRERLREPAVAGFLLMALLMQASHGPFYVFFSLHLEQLGYGRASIGAFWALGVLAEIAMFMLVGGWLQRLGPSRMLVLCLLAATMRWLLVAALAFEPVVLAVSQSLHALSFAAFHAAAIQIVAQIFPGRLANHGQGLLYGIGQGLGGVLGAVLAGIAWSRGGGELAFSTAAVLAALGLLVALPCMSRLQRWLTGLPSSRPVR